jgi:hypothetical protein
MLVAGCTPGGPRAGPYQAALLGADRRAGRRPSADEDRIAPSAVMTSSVFLPREPFAHESTEQQRDTKDRRDQAFTQDRAHPLLLFESEKYPASGGILS